MKKAKLYNQWHHSNKILLYQDKVQYLKIRERLDFIIESYKILKTNFIEEK